MSGVKISFAQAGGGPSGSAGVAVGLAPGTLGLVGQVVTVTLHETGISATPITRKIELLDVPRLTSSLVPGTLSTSTTAGFTPDGDGGMYRIKATVTDGNGVIYTDVRNFAVPDAFGICNPSFQPDDDVPDYSLEEFNFGGQARGWCFMMEANVAALKSLVGALPTDFNIASQATGDTLKFASGHWVRLAIGATGNVLTVAGGLPTWAAPALPTNLALSGQATGSIAYYSGSAWVQLGIGTTGQYLTVTGGIPAWTTPAGAAALDTIVDPGANQDVTVSATVNTTYPLYGWLTSHSVDLGASPTPGITITLAFMDATSLDLAGSRSLTLTHHGRNIEGAAADLVIDGSTYVSQLGNPCIQIRYISNTLGWKVVN